MTDLNQAIRQEALKRAKEELNQPETTLVDFPDDLALTTARIAQELTAAKWKPLTPGLKLWTEMKRARLRHSGDGEALTGVVNQRSSLDNIEIGVLDEFIELQKPVIPENVKNAVAYLTATPVTFFTATHMSPGERRNFEVIMEWIKSHG